MEGFFFAPLHTLPTTNASVCSLRAALTASSGGPPLSPEAAPVTTVLNCRRAELNRVGRPQQATGRECMCV